MQNLKQIQRIDIKEFHLDKILPDLERRGHPRIITKDGRGIAAVLPYVDPDILIRKKQIKK